MTTIELIYDRDCPNVLKTRSNLIQALSQLQLKPHWQEWEIHNSETPDYAKGCGSPTILVDGKDITGMDIKDANHCRIYDVNGGSMSGVPLVEDIVSSLIGNKQQINRQNDISKSGLKLAAIPALIIAFLPKVICPFCWPLYTGLLGSIGINFFNYTPYLFPLLVLFLTLTVFGLAAGAKSTRVYWPVFLGGLASLVILTGKFVFDSNTIIYIGITALILSVFWQILSRRTSCIACKH